MIGGPEIYNDARRTLTDISAAMEPQTGFFGRLFGPRLKVLYAATKADYVTDGYRADMKAHMEALVPQLRQAGSSRHISQAMALASVAVTKPGKDDRGRAAVYGWVCAEGPAKLDEPAGPRPAFYAFPSVPRHLPTEADWFFWERAGAIGQRLPEFRPPPDFSRGRQDLPHIGLDEAIEFLVGDYV
jgi:predicted YcjX-like family ATPase